MEQSHTALTPNAAIDKKLGFLLKCYGLTETQFINGMQQQFDMSPSETRSYLDGAALDDPKAAQKLTSFWSDYYSRFSDEFWRIENALLYPIISNALADKRSLTVSGDGLLSVISEDDMDAICGRYVVYRYSFNNDKSIVRDVMYIKAAKVGGFFDEITALDIEWSQPSITNGSAEIYFGRLHLVGSVFWGTLLFSRDHYRRLQTIMIPKAHFSEGHDNITGIMAGTSGRSESPVACRFFAQKTAGNNDETSDEPSKLPPDQIDPNIMSHIANGTNLLSLLSPTDSACLT